MGKVEENQIALGYNFKQSDSCPFNKYDEKTQTLMIMYNMCYP